MHLIEYDSNLSEYNKMISDIQAREAKNKARRRRK